MREYSLSGPHLIIEMHSAVIPEAYLQHLEQHADRYSMDVSIDDEGQRYMVPRRPIPVYGTRSIAVQPAHWDLAIRLDYMNRTGVDIQALSTPTTLFNYWQPPELGATLASLINDAIAELASQRPTRFLGIATVPLQDPKRAVVELERVVEKHGLHAVEVGSSVNGWELDNRVLWPFWEAAEALDIPIFVHGNEVPGFERMERWFLPALLGIPVASGLALLNLIFGGVLEAFPRLRFWFPHGGGALPYLRGRMDHVYEVHTGANEAIPRPPSTYLNQVYFDTITFYEPALTYLVEAVGEDHILFGTDYPFSVGQLDGAAWIRNHPALSPTAREKILGGNAMGLLGLQHNGISVAHDQQSGASD
jgi:aminocarboxymuconate-semialdehyde decarboxylase